LAGAIVPGVVRFMVTLSAQADVFGVGTTVVVGSMLVLTSSVIAGWIVPGGELGGISGVESGKAAPLVGGPPAIELHTVVDELPSAVVGEVFPVVVPTIGVGMVPNGVDDTIVVGDIDVVDGIVVTVLPAMDVETGVGTSAAVMEGGGGAGIAGGGDAGTVEPGKSDMNDVAGCADSSNGAVVLAVAGADEIAGTADVVGAADVGAAVVALVADTEVTDTGGVPGVISPVGVEQVTTVPGVVGSAASGTAANVVTGVPGCVVAENGPGPLSGDVTIAPGVEERPMAVLPMVETCAGQAVHVASMVAIVNSKRRISIPCSVPL
jgi:hypothetical protein